MSDRRRRRRKNSGEESEEENADRSEVVSSKNLVSKLLPFKLKVTNYSRAFESFL